VRQAVPAELSDHDQGKDKLKMATVTRELTWREITNMEPCLRRLYTDIRAIKDDRSNPRFCANAVWYGWYG
jgi:hypothetical protein